jgi:hypothetical protein
MDHHPRTHSHRLYVCRQHRDRMDLAAARLVDDTHVTTRRATARDCISILSRTGPKISQVLQQSVCNRSEWSHPRHTSKNSYIASWIGGLVDPRNAGGRHLSSSVYTYRDADLCGCIYIGDCQKPPEPRSATTGLIGRMGAGPTWPEWRMGTVHPRHRAPALGVQSDRARQDSRFSSSRKCGGQGREASAVPVFGTFGGGIWGNRRWQRWTTGPYTSSRMLKKSVLHDHFPLLSQRRHEEAKIFFLSMGIL